MKRSILLLALFFLLTLYPGKSQQISNIEMNNISDIIEIAINDFVKSERISKKDSIFRIEFMSINENLIAVSIFGTLNKLVPTPENGIGSSHPSFPTEYRHINSKLFFWYDSTKEVTIDLIKALSDYHQIDSVNVKGIIEFPEQRIDDSKKGTDYFFCRNNIYKYKKVTTSSAMGYYKAPKLNCK